MQHALNQVVTALSSDRLPRGLYGRREPLERLARFLLHRMGHPAPYLIVGLLGPNNAGKSTLFTRLTGCDISPPAPDGGYTRSLSAAAHPRTYQRLLQENHFSGFEVIEATSALDDEQRARVAPNSLFIASSHATPPHLVVIDAPDFDSIDAGNHKVSQSLAAVADLIVCVVTKHTYSNATVRSVMSSAVDGKRPYIVVYNEAGSPDVAHRHLAALVQDLKSEPVGFFYAPHDLTVPLNPKNLKVLGVKDDRPFALDAWSPVEVQDLLIRANTSKIRGLTLGASGFADEWSGHAARLKRVIAAVQTAANDLGQKVGEHCYPLQPLHDAFIAVLDERSEGHAMARAPLVVTAKWIVAGGRWVRRKVKEHVLDEHVPPADDRPELPLIEAEKAALHKDWGHFIDGLKRAIRDAEVAGLDRAFLDDALRPDRLDEFKAVTLAEMAKDPIPETYREFCKNEIRKALDQCDNESEIQALATAIAVLPVAAGAGAIFVTGGIGGEDLAIAAVTSATTPLFEKLLNFVGEDAKARLRKEWTRGATERVAAAALTGFSGDTLGEWREAAMEGERQARQLLSAVATLRARVEEKERG